MPDRITARSFVDETREDMASPTTSNFFASMSSCRNTVNLLEESLDSDKTVLSKLKKSMKALHGAGLSHVANQVAKAESLEKLGSQAISREADTGIGTTFLKFSVMMKELSSLMKVLYTNYYNLIMFPLDSLLKGDLKDIKGELRKPFDKAWKDYEAKCSKIEKEKKKIAQDAGLIRSEVTGSEMAEETERERRMFQLQMCEVNEIKVKKSVDIAQHLVDFYHSQITYYQESLQVLDSLRGYVEELMHELQQLRSKQDEERKELVEMRTEIKSILQVDKEPSKGGYSLHGQQGDMIHGMEKSGYLFKRSEGLRKMWQKRYCSVRDGQFTLAHSPTSRPTQTLNLLVCQVKEESEGKKHSFTIFSNNRTFLFQAEDEADLDAWVSVISNSRKDALEKAFGDNEKIEPVDGSSSVVHNVKELRQSIVGQIQRLPGNDTCVDCTSKDPTWLSTNLGVLTCIECSGVHRDMGVHISRVRSLTLDNLGTAELLLAKAIGNGGFNEIMEATLDINKKPTSSSKMEDKKEFIRAKYVKHQYAQKSGDSPEKILQELHQAVKSRDILAVLQGFGEGVDLSATLPGSTKWNTAIHEAVDQEDLTSLHIVDFLAQNCNDMNVANLEGNTALHLAALSGKTEVIKVLLRSGSVEAIHLENSNGKTPVQLAKENGHVESLDLLKKCAKGKLTFCEHVKIDWGLNQAADFKDDVIDISDIKMSLSDDETLSDSNKSTNKTKSGPPTPPRHRRHLPPRPASQMIMPSRPESSISSLLSGLSLHGSENFAAPFSPLGTGDRFVKGSASPVVMRRKAPAPPQTGETVQVPVNVRASVALPSSAGVTTSTFGHGPRTSQDEVSRMSDSLESPPPIPPVRCSSVSRPPRIGAQPPPPPLPKPLFEDAPTRTPSGVETRGNPDATRRPPPIPPAPKKSLETKPAPPAIPTHKRSKSDGRAYFGEDVPDKGKKRLEGKKSLPLGDTGPIEDEGKAERPALPPRPAGLKKLPVADPRNGEVGPGSSKQKAATLPRPPPPPATPPPPIRHDSEPTIKVQPPALEEPLDKIQENSGSSTSSAPEVPPRLYSSPVHSSPFPRRVQALYDCEADNEDELSFKEGDVIIVHGQGEDAEWWVGEVERNPGVTGVFPMSFVCVLSD